MRILRCATFGVKRSRNSATDICRTYDKNVVAAEALGFMPSAKTSTAFGCPSAVLVMSAAWSAASGVNNKMVKRVRVCFVGFIL